MQITVNADEIFNEYKVQIAELNHELMLERLKNRKLLEHIEQQGQQAPPMPARARQTPQERLPVIPAPPAPPSASGERSGAMGDQTA